MKDSYGTLQVYLVEPSKIDYGQDYQPHRTYRTASDRGIEGGIRMQLDRENAERFSKFNGLKLITEAEQISIIENNSIDEPWPEEYAKKNNDLHDGLTFGRNTV